MLVQAVAVLVPPSVGHATSTASRTRAASPAPDPLSPLDQPPALFGAGPHARPRSLVAGPAAAGMVRVAGAQSDAATSQPGGHEGVRELGLGSRPARPLQPLPPLVCYWLFVAPMCLLDFGMFEAISKSNTPMSGASRMGCGNLK